jgi:iron complex transport system substrate-binding protein
MFSSGARSRGRLFRMATLACALVLALLVQFAGPLRTWANPAAQGTITLTDVVGRTVTVKAPAKRVLLSEGRQVYVVATLDKDDPFRRVVGWGDDLRTADYDSYVQYLEKFPHLQQIPVMGSPQSGSFSMEKAVELQPDVVVFGLDSYPAARDAGLVEVLASAGIPSIVIDFRQQPLETTVPSILLLGRVFGKQAEAQELVDYYTQQINTVFARVEKIRSPQPTFFILRAAGLLDCCGTFGRANLGILGERAGGTNIAAGLFPGWSGTINPEQVLTSDPDIIIATGSNWTYQPNAKQYIPFGYHTTPDQARTALRQLTDQPGWAGLKAVQTGRFYGVWHQFYISPFHFAVLQQFAKWMYPAEFADIDPEANLRTYHERFLPISYGGTFWVGLNE